MNRLSRASIACGLVFASMLLLVACQETEPARPADGETAAFVSGCHMPHVRPQRDAFYSKGLDAETARAVGGHLVLVTLDMKQPSGSGLLALNGSTGAELWSYTLPSGMRLDKPVLIGGNEVQVLASPRKGEANHGPAMFVLAAGSGELLRQLELPGRADGAVSDGRVLYIKDATGVIAWSPKTGQQLWKTAVPSLASLYLGRSVLLVHTFEDEVVALSRAEGKELWRIAGKNTRQIMPTQDGVVLLHTEMSMTHTRVCSLLDEKTGESRWTVDLPSPIRSLHEASVAMHDGVLCYMSIGVPREDATNTISNMTAILGLSVETGDILWTLTEPERWKVPPLSRLSVMAGDRIFLLSTDGGVRALDATTGEQLWAARSIDQQGMAFSTLAGDMQHFYLVAVHPSFSDYHGIVCLDAKDGSPVWKQPISIVGVKPKREMIYVAGGGPADEE